MTEETAAPSRKFSLTEDWLATIIGLLIIVVIGRGLIGPGPQKVELSAAAGGTDQTQARAMSGWSVSVKIGDTDVAIGFADQLDQLQADTMYQFACHNENEIEVRVLQGGVEEGEALLTLDNDCTEEITITLKISDTAIPWPAFGLFE